MPDTRITWSDPVPRVRRAARTGLNVAAEHLLGLVKPIEPHLGGDMEERTTVHQVASEDAIEEGAQIQVDTAYAVYQHEGEHADGSGGITRHTTEPNAAAQTHFVSEPLEQNRELLLAIVAGSIAAALR